MKRRSVIAAVLALILAMGMFSVPSAAASTGSAYYIVEQVTPLFEKLPDEHYGPEVVAEYDEEHFAVFCDADQGYWGIGLKAECYPLSESDSYTFENPAVIILADAGYDNNRFETFDLIISIGRVTYASVPGSVLNGEADVLGVFGYSREMETIGLLSGWGCRAQKDENGTVITDGGVWQVADEAAYDTAGLCTEAEISVTAVRKDGREIAPKHVGWTSWIVADLDMLQIEGSAVGGTREYEPHYFDEQLILCDGFVGWYNLQRENVLTPDSKERTNDSELGHGEMTGLAEGELAKRYSSMLLKQEQITAHAVWRGCGSEEAPARTELVIKGSQKQPVSKFTVTYVVTPDPIYGTPEGSNTPSDSNRYKAGETVDVVNPLTTAVDYAYNSEGLKVKGTWEFETWDKDDFPIYENTTITGGWKFTPAPAKKYTYTVHYKLYEGSIANAATVHADTQGTVDALGDKAEIDAIAVKSLNAKYRNIKKYQIRPGFEHVSVTITHDNYEITIWYQPISTGM